MDPEPMSAEEKPAEEQKPTEETPAVPPETPAVPTETPQQTEQPPAIPEIPSQAPVEPPPPSPEATEGQASPEPAVPQPVQSSIKAFLGKAFESLQFRKKARLEKIMKLASEKRSITNDQVQKLLRVSDATATRYLSTLVRQGRLKRLGIRGSARYEPMVGSIPAI